MQARKRMVRGGFPRWEDEPLVALAFVLTVGVAVLGPWTLVPVATEVGALALFLVAALAGARVGGRAALVAGTLMAGATLGAAGEPGGEPDDLVQGRVRSSAGIAAVVDSAAGSVRLLFPEDVPSVGQAISARTRSTTPTPRLPGAPDSSREDRRSGRKTRRVLHFVPIGSDVARPEMPLVFAEADHGGLLWSLASGARSEVRPEEKALLQRTGTAHLLAISGMHIGFVAGLVWGSGQLLAKLLARLLPRVRVTRVLSGSAALGAVVAACAYASVVGWPVSARRAVVMVAGASAARMLGRPIRPWSLLALAALGVVCLDPDAVHGLGFGLSFGAVVGILTVSQGLLRWVPPDLPRGVDWLVNGLVVTVGATVGTLPLTAWWFQSLSPWSPLANLIAGPLVGAVGVPSALVAAYGPTGLAPTAIWVGDRAVSWALWGLDLLDVAPWAPAVGPLGVLGLAVAAAVHRRPLLACAVLGAVWALPAARTPTGLEVTVLSVGQGDAIFIRLPDGRRWLVDGGPPSHRVVEWLRREGHTHLDTVFLTHPDSDHLGGLAAVVDELSVERFVTARPPRLDERSYREVWMRLYERGIAVQYPDAPLFGPGVLLHPMPDWREAAGATRRPKDNDDSLVLLLHHEGRSILLPGDIEGAAETWLGPNLPRVDVLLAPHHGSRTSSSPALVAATDPSTVVISCGRENRFGHPHIQTLTRWRGRDVHRTDLQGTLRIRLDDGEVTIDRWAHGSGFRPSEPWRWAPRPPTR
jgi:competence protein ComEC